MDEHVLKICDKVSSVLATSNILDSVVVVGVSGGPDSSVLLHVLSYLKDIYRLDLEVVYIDHGLRTNSNDDAKYVKKLANSFGIDNFHICTVSEEISELLNYYSPEDAARRARYGALILKARKVGAKYIAVGHNQDDQLETLLMHMIRGSALNGLVGMSFVGEIKSSKEENIRLIRPLLEINRSDIELYCRMIDINPLIDYTNDDLRIPRNYIRHKITPAFHKMNPKIGNAINRLSKNVKLDLDFIHKFVLEAWNDIALINEGQIVLNRLKFINLHLSIQRYIVIHAYEYVNNSIALLSELHINLILDIASGSSGRSINLPNDLIARSTRDSIVIGAYHEDNKLINFDECKNVLIPGTSFFSNSLIKCSIEDRPSEFSIDPCVEFFDIGFAKEQLFVRFNYKGDFFQPLGMHGHKKLQDFFTDSYLEKNERRNIPVLTSSKGIIWVVGHRISEFAKTKMGATKVLRVEFLKLNLN
jgi:tRNA(Ile)-lysidine synthase